MYDSIEGFVFDHRLLTIGVIIAVWWFWAYVKPILLAGGSKLATIATAGKTVVTTAITLDSNLETVISNLQAMTVWAVRNGSPEVLAKITALYHDLQQAGKESK